MKVLHLASITALAIAATACSRDARMPIAPTSQGLLTTTSNTSNLISTVIFTHHTADGEQFAPYSATFTPTQTGNYTLGFNLTAGGPSTDNSVLIDAVKVTNGAATVFADGFETPALASNAGVSANGTSATYGAWAFNNYSGILNGSPANWGLAGPASIGGGSGLFTLAPADGTHQYAYLQAVAGTFGTMKAVNKLPLVVGQTYTVSFYQASRYDFGGTTTYTVTLDYVAPSFAICAASGRNDDNADSSNQESGSTIPVKVKVCDASGKNVGAKSLSVKAVGISPTGSLNDSGKANPGMLFRFDEATYMFNLSTKGLAAGSYTLDYTIGNDPMVNHYAFSIRSKKSDSSEKNNEGKKP